MKPIHIAAATIGNALAFYDFFIYSFFLTQLGQAFFSAESAYLSVMKSLATYGVGFLTRPLGAYIIGNYSDRKGRRSAMVLCSFLLGCATAGMAVIPSYSQIGIAAPALFVIARMVQGFALGGEIGPSTAYLAEAASPTRRGFVVSWQMVSQNVALVAAGLVATFLTSLLTSEQLAANAWRIAFFIGAAAVPFGWWLRTSIPETLHAEEARARVVHRPRLHEALMHSRTFGLGLIVLSAGAISYSIFNYIVTYAKIELRLPAWAGSMAETSGYALGVPMALLGGWLSDRYGRRPINLIGNGVFLGLIYPAFAWITATRSEIALIVGMTTLIGAASFMWGSFFAGLAESVPAAIRGFSVGIVYSVAIALFGGTTPVVTKWLICVSGSAMVPAWCLIGATTLGQIALWLMAETAPVRLARVKSVFT